MSAAPQPRPPEKAPPLNRYGRNPLSPSERLRKQSNYEKDAGYAPFFHALRADIYRLASGKAGLALLLEALAESLGRHEGKGPRPEWTGNLKVRDLAQTIGTDERTIERELLGIEKRKVAEIRKQGKGIVSLRLLYRDWEKLPDYQSSVVDISTGEEVGEEEAKDEQQAKHERVELTRKPQAAPAGKLSRKIPVTCGVTALRLQNDSIVDLSFTAVVQAGELILSSKVPDAWLKDAAKRIGVLNETNNLGAPKRHGCRVDSPIVRHESKGEDKRKKSEHPRAVELSRLFDPLLQKSQSRLLSADPIVLSVACQAIGNTDHNFLVHYLMNPKGRGSRPISSPKVIPAILRECRQNWEAEQTQRDKAKSKSSAWDRHQHNEAMEAARRTLADAKATEADKQIARIVLEV